MTIKNIEFVLVKKIKNKNLENKEKENTNNSYKIDIYNHEFYVVKVQPGSREIVILGINMNVELKEENHSKKSNSTSTSNNPKNNKSKKKKENTKKMN